MKTILIIVGILIVIIFTSCTKHSDNNPQPVKYKDSVGKVGIMNPALERHYNKP